MATSLRIATFNLENFDDRPGESPTLAERIAVMRPQLRRLRADVLCLQEVNGQESAGQPRTLSALRELLLDTRYEGYHMAHTKTQAGEPYNVRNLVFLSRFPIEHVAQIKHLHAPPPRYTRITATPADAQPVEIAWERPILYVRLDVSLGRTLHVLNLHMKSKLPTNIPGQKESTFVWKSFSGWAEGSFISAMKRVGQALEARRLIDEIFDDDGLDALIAVCGDLNADTHEVELKAICGPIEEAGNPELVGRTLAPCENNIPDSSRYSLLHLGAGEMIDHVLASRALLSHFRGGEIHNEVLPDESGAFRTDEKFPESDHAPVVADFELP